MSWSRIAKSLSTAESVTVSAICVFIHISAYIDREKEYDENMQDDFNLTLMSEVIASLHTLGTLLKILDNHNRAGVSVQQTRYKAITAGSVVGSLASLTTAWATSHSQVSLGCSIANAGCNFFSRLSSAVYKHAVHNESLVDFDSVAHNSSDPAHLGSDYHDLPSPTASQV
ncbi:MAG: hypothetical protein P4M12_03800 [Gammaproteobacteria bacterium]|nr:hypothetical protein [Gammaproteobacteria bacterium]